MQDRLLEWADRRGYRVAWGPASSVEAAHADVQHRLATGELDAAFFHSEIEPLAAAPLPDPALTVVVVAKPVPAHLVRFRLEDGAVDGVIPPTYVRYRATFEEVRQDLSRHGLPGASLDHLSWPVKAVASRLGLARYGRNNLTYVEGLGSYVQLCGYLTDADLPAIRDGLLAAPSLLDACTSCAACVTACPTGAIDEERVLIHGERCLTCLNENAGDWPEWLSPSVHHCLLGCLACQQACPANRPLETVDTGLEFSPSESRLLLGGGAAATAAAGMGIRCKLAWLGQPYAEPVLGRNLRALLAAAARR